MSCKYSVWDSNWIVWLSAVTHSVIFLSDYSLSELA